MSRQEVESASVPPSRWPLMAMARAVFVYGIESCQRCGATVGPYVWAMRGHDRGFVCQRCMRLEYGIRERS